MTPLPEIGDEVEVAIEVPRLSFVKRRPDGTVHFVSPLPTLFNYGSVPGTVAADGDPLDALVLGRRLRRGSRVRRFVRGIVDFLDHDVPDPKLVLARAPLSLAERRRIERFFRTYAHAKRWLDPGPGQTCWRGWIA